MKRTASTAYTLTLEWDEPQGQYENFQVTYQPADGLEDGESLPLIVEASLNPSIVIDNLMAFAKYDVCVVTVSGLKQSEQACVCVYTRK